MKGKTFAILLLVAGLLVALALIPNGKDTGPTGPKMGDRLFADLPVNQVAEVTLADAGNRTTLVKGETVWQVKDRNGYPADFDQIRDTVVKLSRLKIGRGFAGDSETLARLSLLPPSDPDASGRGSRVVLKDTSGKTLADLVLGQVRSTEGGGSGGQYLKKGDADTVFLVDASFRFLKAAPAEWLQKEVLNIKADAVQSVACYAGKEPEPVYSLTRPEKGQAAELKPVPEGRSVDANRIDQVMEALAPLTLDDVQPADGPPVASDAQFKLVYSLYDGREIVVYPLAEAGERYTLRVEAREKPGENVPAEEEQTESPDADENGDEEKTDAETDAAPAVKTAREINQSLVPWTFVIKKWQFDSFATRPESLLKEVKKEA